MQCHQLLGTEREWYTIEGRVSHLNAEALLEVAFIATRKETQSNQSAEPITVMCMREWLDSNWLKMKFS